jgi:HSP20 family protein
MGIMDKITALLPRRGERPEPRPAQTDVMALRDGFDRWLQRFLESPWEDRAPGEPPSVELHETADAVAVTAEVPGLDRDDVSLMLTPQGLVIRGENREKREDKRKDYYLVESRYGSFVRTVPLPPGLDLDHAEADVRNGVLTVRFPKAAGRSGTRRIPIVT